MIWGYFINNSEPLPFNSLPYDFVKQLVDVSDSLQISIKITWDYNILLANR